MIESEENEIKLVTQAKMLAALRGKKTNEQDSVLRTLKGALNFAEFDVSQERVENIIDEYFDTDDLALFGFHASLRIRRSGPKAEITVKKLKEQERGQFTRSELSQTISEDEYLKFIRDGFQQIAESAHLDVLGKPLLLTLRVDNERRTFRLRRGDEHYELSLDLLKFINPKTHKASEIQSEIEIEALNEAAKQKLGNIRRSLIDIMGTFNFSPDSKYERGIKHLNLNKTNQNIHTKWLSNFNTEAGRDWINIAVAIIGIIVTVILAKLFGR